MVNTPLGYEAATVFHRVRSERLVNGVGLAVVLAMMTYSVSVLRRDRLDRAVLYGSLLLLTFFLLRQVRALLRSRSAWEIRIAGDRLYLRLAGDPSEQSAQLADIRHVMVARYGTGKRRYIKAFLLLCDSRCWEVPGELLFPRRPLFRAICRAAPHVTVVTNSQMPQLDPLNESARTAGSPIVDDHC